MKPVKIISIVTILTMTGALLTAEINETENESEEKYTFTEKEKALLQKGRAVYWGNGGCVNCHGATGEGDGPISLSLNEQPKPFIFPAEFWKNKPTLEGIIKTLNEGITPDYIMPSYKGHLTPEEIRAVSFFVLKLGNKLPDRYLADRPDKNPED